MSNIQGTDVVASMVVFEDGLPRKSEYRRFTVRGTDGQDDVAAIHEVITRRFRRYLEERSEQPGAATSATPTRTTALPATATAATGGGRPDRPRDRAAARFAYPPNLVVVDGGPPQVAAAARALAELGIDDVALCGLAKRLEEVWLPGRGPPGGPAAHQRGAVPAAAGPRRGAPVRHHPPPPAAAARR